MVPLSGAYVVDLRSDKQLMQWSPPVWWLKCACSRCWDNI